MSHSALAASLLRSRNQPASPASSPTPLTAPNFDYIHQLESANQLLKSAVAKQQETIRDLQTQTQKNNLFTTKTISIQHKQLQKIEDLKRRNTTNLITAGMIGIATAATAAAAAYHLGANPDILKPVSKFFVTTLPGLLF